MVGQSPLPRSNALFAASNASKAVSDSMSGIVPRNVGAISPDSFSV